MEIQKKEGVRAKGGEGGRGREKLMLDFENSLRFILHTQGHCVCRSPAFSCLHTWDLYTKFVNSSSQFSLTVKLATDTTEGSLVCW